MVRWEEIYLQLNITLLIFSYLILFTKCCHRIGTAIVSCFTKPGTLNKSIQYKGNNTRVAERIKYLRVKKDSLWDRNLPHSSHPIYKDLQSQNSTYSTVVVELTEVSCVEALQWFKILSPCSSPYNRFGIRFLVSSLPVKYSMVLYCLATGNAFWHHIFHNRNTLRNSLKNDMAFSMVTFEK